MSKCEPELELLLACARGEPAPRLDELLSQARADRIVPLARRHGMLPMAHVTLRDVPSLDARLAEQLEGWYHRSLAGHMRALADAAVATTCLEGAGIVNVLAKGPVLAEAVYPRSDLRAYTDIDLFVDRSSFAAAVDALERGGCELLDRNWSMLRRELRGQLHLRGAYGTPIDLHWSLFNLAEVRGHLEVPMSELLDRRRPVQVADVTAQTFDPQDTLITLALHAALGGGARISWLNDLSFSAGRVDDWRPVAERARQWGIGPTIWSVLRRSSRLVGAPVPSAALGELAAPAPWRLALSGAERLSPPLLGVSRATLSTLMTNATRQSTASSATALLSKARRLRSPEARPMLASGDAADRAAYFERVAAT